MAVASIDRRGEVAAPLNSRAARRCRPARLLLFIMLQHIACVTRAMAARF